MIQAVVLAAGESRRMGKPKPLLRFHSTTFLGQILTTLQAAPVDAITVVLGAQADIIAETVDGSDVNVIVNRDYPQGQLSSLIAALRGIPPEAEALLLCLVDHPFLTVELVTRMIDAFRETHAPIVIPTFEQRRGHPTLFARALFDPLAGAPIEEGARQVVYAHEDQILEVATPDRSTLIGINTPDDYRTHFGMDP